MPSMNGIPNPTGEKQITSGKGGGRGRDGDGERGEEEERRETLKKMCAQSNKASWDM